MVVSLILDAKKKESFGNHHQSVLFEAIHQPLNLMKLFKSLSAAVADVVSPSRVFDMKSDTVLSEYTDLPLEEIDNIRLLRVVELDLRERLSKKKFLRKGFNDLRMQLEAITARIMLLMAVAEEKYSHARAEVQLCELILANNDNYSEEMIEEAQEDIIWYYEELDRLNAVVPYPRETPTKIYKDRWHVDWGFESYIQ